MILNIEQIISQDEVRALYSFDIYILLKIESIQLAHSCETVAAAISSVSIEFSSSAQSRHQREATTSNSTKIHFNHTFSRERETTCKISLQCIFGMFIEMNTSFSLVPMFCY